ncbi:phage tail tip fiber protein [Ectopseudomonas khazarica]|uniref:phage tail tip fiber protein n=1 Tax=Ectopseudomonas khazarica TaxID=2502979 RepID=UPI00403355A7
MAEMLETGQGVRGNKLDRNLTLRDLVEGGLAKLRIPGNADGGLEIVVPTQPPDLSRPPVPTGFAAVGTFFGMVNISWDMPFEAYGNHAFTNIYRSETDNFANATVIGREAQGGYYTDYVRNDALDPDSELEIQGHYYWITFVSTSGVEGAPNSPSGTFAKPLPDAGYLLEQLSGQLGESELEQALRSRLDGIERNETAISQQQVVIQGLSALYTLKLNVNGYISGFGAYNDGRTADFAVLADRFWIARPGVAASAVKPFMVVDGKVYIDSAFIREASIQEGQLGPITFGKIFDPAGRPVTSVGGKLKADYIEVDELLAAVLRADTAFIRNAHIQDAAITNAKIGNLEVDTLKIAGNAVTIPESVTGRAGNVAAGSTSRLLGRYINMPEGSSGVIVMVTVPARAEGSNCSARLLIKANGQAVSMRHFTLLNAYMSSISIFEMVPVNPGTTLFEVELISPTDGPGANIPIAYAPPTAVFIGAKR